jgi:hypothetical protein
MDVEQHKSSIRQSDLGTVKGDGSRRLSYVNSASQSRDRFPVSARDWSGKKTKLSGEVIVVRKVHTFGESRSACEPLGLPGFDGRSSYRA